MKKLKLLSSLSALLLVLSVGACDHNVTEDSSSDEVTSSESDSSTSSSESTPAPVELSNYTISITFVDTEGETTAIPEYGTAYIIGGWDSWATFIPLTENEGKYTYTFDTITEGSYTYKVVEWYEGEDVGWNSETETNCVEITATDQTLVVSAAEGDNATHEITITLDVALPPLLTDEDIIAGILGAASQVFYPVEIGWTAYHFESVEDEETDIYDMTENGEKAYGRWVNIDDEEQATVRYIVDGTQYIYDASDDDDPYSTITFSDSFDWILEDWYPCEPLERVASYGDEEDPLDLDAFDSVTLTKGLQDYTLVLEESNVWSEDDGSDNETYTIVTDFSFNLIGLAYDENDNGDVTSHSAEKISASEVEAIINAVDFGPWIYDTDEDPVADMFDAIGEGLNYTLTIEYYDRMTDYYSTSEEAAAAWNAGQRYSQDLYVQITYTEDAILMEYYTSYIEYLFGYLADVELYVNTEVYVDEDGDVVDEQEEGAELTDATAIYWLAEDEETGDVALTLSGYYEGHWQDVFWSALDLVSDGFPATFKMGQTTLSSYGPETDYTFTQILADANYLSYFIECLFSAGNWFADYYTDGPYIFETIAGAYYYYSGFYAGAATYYADYGKLDVELQTATIGWTGTYSDGTEVHWYENNYMCASIWNVGTSAIPEEYASYLQA